MWVREKICPTKPNKKNLLSMKLLNVKQLMWIYKHWWKFLGDSLQRLYKNEENLMESMHNGMNVQLNWTFKKDMN
jgi:hypothetical protein